MLLAVLNEMSVIKFFGTDTDNIRHRSTPFDTVLHLTTPFDIVKLRSTPFDTVWNRSTPFDNVIIFKKNLRYLKNACQIFVKICDIKRFSSEWNEVVSNRCVMIDEWYARHFVSSLLQHVWIFKTQIYSFLSLKTPSTRHRKTKNT